MNLKQLQNVVNQIVKNIENTKPITLQGTQNGVDKIPVEIQLNETTIGPLKTSSVTNIGLGFDWDAGKLLIYPEDNLVREEYGIGETRIIEEDGACFCRNCCTKVKGSDLFCSHCGKKFISEKED